MDPDPAVFDVGPDGVVALDRTVAAPWTRVPARSARPRPTERPPKSMRDDAGDALLVQRARTGDREAFDELVRRHFERVHRLVHRMLDDHEDAEDVAQESFVRAYRALAGFREDATFATWVQRIAVHAAVARLRRRGRGRPVLSIGDDDVEQPSGSEPAAEHARGELESALSNALDRLPPKLRAAIVLRTVEEREYPEMAEILGVQPATARTHVMQARKLLVRWLEPWLAKEPR